MLLKQPIRALIGLLAVLVIIGVIIGLSVPVVVSPGMKAPVNATKATLSNTRSALQAFKVQFDRYPSTAEGLASLVEAPAGLAGWDHQFMENIPEDAWRHFFRYRFPGLTDPHVFELVSAGADGKFDTADDISVNDP